MTSEEREKKINEILRLVEDWPIEFLIEQIQENWLPYLDKLSDHELDVEHDGHFEGRDLGAMM